MIYKNGQLEDFWCDEFEAYKDGTRLQWIRWVPSHEDRRPIIIGIEEVAACYQLGIKEDTIDDGTRLEEEFEVYPKDALKPQKFILTTESESEETDE